MDDTSFLCRRPACGRSRCPACGQRGLTLVELLVVVAIIAVLARLAIPAFNDFFAIQHVRQATEDIYGLVMLAKAEGPIRDQNLSVSARPDASPWCLGVAATPACDCSDDVSCTIRVGATDVLQVLRGSDYPHVTISSNFVTTGQGPTFNRIRGNTPGGTFTVQSGGWEAQVRVSPQGRIRVCAPSGGSRLGYADC